VDLRDSVRIRDGRRPNARAGLLRSAHG
jgi:hypothetical protein